MEVGPPQPVDGSGRIIRNVIRGLQNRFAAMFEVTIDGRSATVAAMLHRGPAEPVQYWLQLSLSVGIATFGLVLDSAAVVIGAMLISPLMSPLVGFGMGLAIGSPFLVIRSFLRTLFSVVYVVAAGALLTNLLPLNQVTSEIAARTSPTALDLVIAAFCAVAAAYTTVRSTSETASAAAGTAIGIALVPPLCVSGYGFGSWIGHIAGGALLLFTANFCAILLVSVLIFLALGFNQVPVQELERGELERGTDSSIARKIVGALAGFFASKYGPALRVLMPAVLVAIVYVPLRNALGEVTWEVRARSAADKVLSDMPQRAVQTNVVVEHRTLTIRLVTVGSRAEAEAMEKEIAKKIEAAVHVKPKVSVLAVPDAEALRAVVNTVAVPEPKEVVPETPDLKEAGDELRKSLQESWPAEAAGPLLDWRVSFPERGAMLVRVVHLGAPLGEAGAKLLSDALRASLGLDVGVRDVALSPEPIRADPEQGEAWSSSALARLSSLGVVDGMHACLSYPERLPEEAIGERKPGVTAWTWAKKKKKRLEAFATQRDEVLAQLRASPWVKSGRAEIVAADQWNILLSLKACSKPKSEESAKDPGNGKPEPAPSPPVGSSAPGPK